MKSRNFEILSSSWPELAALGGFAEAYVHDDPASALVKLRLFAENLTKDIYRDLGLPKPDHATFVDLLSNHSFAAIIARREAGEVLTDIARSYNVSVLVVDDLVDLLGRKIILRRVFALRFKLLNLLFGQYVEPYSFAEKLCGVLENFERGKETLLHRLLKIVIRGGQLAFAAE